MFGKLLMIILLLCLCILMKGRLCLFQKDWGRHDVKYGHFSEKERLNMLQKVREMFNFGYDNYMKYAFPKDELNPQSCHGRGPDYDNPYWKNEKKPTYWHNWITETNYIDALLCRNNETEKS